jgi:hypothetical protein
VTLARELARSIDVPIEWTITSGYGASKRILAGSAEEAKLMDPPDSFIHLASNADIDIRLAEKGIGNIHAYSEVAVRCTLFSLPYAGHMELAGYWARFHADQTDLTAPARSIVVFNISVENRADQTWTAGSGNYLRLGVLLRTTDGETVQELAGVILPPDVSSAGGVGMVPVQVNLPEQPGEYKLVIDVVHEFVCWFFEQGSTPLECSLRIE